MKSIDDAASVAELVGDWRHQGAAMMRGKATLVRMGLDTVRGGRRVALEASARAWEAAAVAFEATWDEEVQEHPELGGAPS